MTDRDGTAPPAWTHKPPPEPTLAERLEAQVYGQDKTPDDVPAFLADATTLLKDTAEALGLKGKVTRHDREVALKAGDLELAVVIDSPVAPNVRLTRGEAVTWVTLTDLGSPAWVSNLRGIVNPPKAPE
jgi:hypothetical protein